MLGDDWKLNLLYWKKIESSLFLDHEQFQAMIFIVMMKNTVPKAPPKFLFLLPLAMIKKKL
jgi:hypothetical protein